jgi:hypothetical protein
MLIVINEHVDAALSGCERSACDTSKEFFCDTPAIDAGFCLIELIYKSYLDGLFQAFTEFVKLSESVFELCTTTNTCGMLVELMRCVGSLHDA